MTDREEVLLRLSPHRRKPKSHIRLALKWSAARLRTTLDELEAEGRVSVNTDGVARTLNLTEPAERVFNALPDNGEARSGRVLMQQLGLTAAVLNAARAELKRELLVTSTSGRNNGTLQRIVSAGTRQDERLRLLTEELRLESDLVPSQEALEELFHACFIAPHEGSYPSFGAIIVTEIDAVVEVLHKHGFRLIGDAQKLDGVRPFADGMNSFVLRSENSDRGELLLAPEFRGLERDAIDLAQLTQGEVVQRNLAGVVRLAARDQVSIRENGIWTKKTRADDFLPDVLTTINLPDLEDVAHSLLALCLHVLSPNHVGATLVWFTDREAVPQTGPKKLTGLGWSKAFQPPPLNVADERHSPLILHSLAQLDRAAIISSGGRLLWLGVELLAQTLVAVQGGTRHNSAASFSAEHPESLVCVVSADGPVTIFHNGAVIRTTRR